MKKTIRRNMRAKNLEIQNRCRENYADDIFSIVESSEIFKYGSTVALYASLKDELPTNRVIAEWCKYKKVLLPRVGEDFEMEFYEYNPQYITRGSYGIDEPQCGEAYDPSKIDLIIVPGVAFTRDGKRLGRGKGYYDRYLVREGLCAQTFGVCYPHQIVDDLPCEEHDVLLDRVVTSTL